MALPRVERSSLSDDIYERLRAFILEGRLEPGSRIVEERLAKQLGTSRAPLREAIWRLKSDGLIIGSGRETRTVALTVDDVREFHLLRTTLETLLYQSAARSISTSETSELEQLVEQMLLAAAEGERERLLELDYEFHQKLARASGLPRAYRVWQDQHVLYRMWLNVVAESGGDAGEIAAHHKVLLEAVKSQEPDAIAREVAKHIYGFGHAFASERRAWAQERALLVGDPTNIDVWHKDEGE